MIAIPITNQKCKRISMRLVGGFPSGPATTKQGPVGNPLEDITAEQKMEPTVSALAIPQWFLVVVYHKTPKISIIKISKSIPARELSDDPIRPLRALSRLGTSETHESGSCLIRLFLP